MPDHWTPHTVAYCVIKVAMTRINNKQVNDVVCIVFVKAKTLFLQNFSLGKYFAFCNSFSNKNFRLYCTLYMYSNKVLTTQGKISEETHELNIVFLVGECIKTFSHKLYTCAEFIEWMIHVTLLLLYMYIQCYYHFISLRFFSSLTLHLINPRLVDINRTSVEDQVLLC